MITAGRLADRIGKMRVVAAAMVVAAQAGHRNVFRLCASLVALALVLLLCRSGPREQAGLGGRQPLGPPVAVPAVDPGVAVGEERAE